MTPNPKKVNDPLNIAIIGGGLCGVLTAIHLIQCAEIKAHLYIINKGYPLARGVAFNPHTESLLLNVPNGRMSAFPDDPNHYVNWLRGRTRENADKDELSSEFSTRQEYGDYLSEQWESVFENMGANKTVTFVNDYADNVTSDGDLLHIHLRRDSTVTVRIAILATGNANPGMPRGISKSFLKSKSYFANPWHKSCVEDIDTKGDVLIIGAGLTAIDAIIGIRQRGYQQTIHTISPNGYCIKAWRENKLPYTGISIEEISVENLSLSQFLKIFNQHRKLAKYLDQSVYSIVDSFRPYTQKIWQGFSLGEKQQFMRHLRIFWEKARHRLPNHQHEIIADMLKSKQLKAHKGRIISVEDTTGGAVVKFICDGKSELLKVQRVINCISPEANIERQENPLLGNLVKNGLIKPGHCNMGIFADPHDGSVISAKPYFVPNLFVIGGNLKGMLWESTAVPELRMQAIRIADAIKGKFTRPY